LNRLLKHPVVSTVVGGLFLSVIMWFFGILPDVWLSIQSFGKSIGDALAVKLEIYVWVIIICAIPLLLSLKMILSQFVFLKDSELIATVNNQQPIELTEEEHKVLELLVQKDGAAVEFSDLKHRLKLPRLQAQQILDALVGLTLIEVYENQFHGPQIYLTDYGRDFMLGNKYVRT
jgi:DNA-binding MarR family transcriptional regulator